MGRTLYNSAADFAAIIAGAILLGTERSLLCQPLRGANCPKRFDERDRTLPEAIASVLKQTYDNYEIICVQVAVPVLKFST